MAALDGGPRRTVVWPLVASLVVCLVVGCTGSPTKEPSAAPSSPTAKSSDAVRRIAAFPDPPTTQVTAAVAEALQAVLDSAVKERTSVGVTAAVISPAGIWTGAAGDGGDGRRLDPRAQLAIASITKTFVAAEVMRLVEDGKIDLDAKLSSYVPLPVPDRGATVRDALSHRSGIPDYFTDALVKRALSAPNRHWKPSEVLTDLPASEAGTPNTAFAYSNTNFTLLGQTVEKVTGQSLPAILRAELITPAGLDRVSFQDAEPTRPPLGRWTADKAGSGPYLPTRSIASLDWAAGAMAADAASIARWGYLLYGGHVLDDESLTAMLPDEVGYGLGTRADRLTYNGLLYVGHGGGTVGYSSWLGVCRDKQFAIAVLAPQGDVDTDVLGDDLATVVLEAA
jgi:D-alanyl-D-alanine carboxypeptidase